MHLSQGRAVKLLSFLLIPEANILLGSGTRQPRAGWNSGALWCGREVFSKHTTFLLAG